MSVPRTARVREEIKKEASDIIQRRLKDPRIGFTTVTDVEVSQDLRHVKIFVSVLGSEEAIARTLEALERAKGFIRTEIGRRIRLRHTPEIHLALDRSIERGTRLVQLLKDVGEKDQESRQEEGVDDEQVSP